jgi:hypothetical protein
MKISTNESRESNGEDVGRNSKSGNGNKVDSSPIDNTVGLFRF